MGGTPTVTFDKSTLTPIASGAPATAAPGPSTGAVTFDKSTLTPIPPTAGPGEQIGYSGLKDIVPKPGESFDDTMQRAIAYGKDSEQGGSSQAVSGRFERLRRWHLRPVQRSPRDNWRNPGLQRVRALERSRLPAPPRLRPWEPAFWMKRAGRLCERH